MLTVSAGRCLCVRAHATPRLPDSCASRRVWLGVCGWLDLHPSIAYQGLGAGFSSTRVCKGVQTSSLSDSDALDNTKLPSQWQTSKQGKQTVKITQARWWAQRSAAATKTKRTTQASAASEGEVLDADNPRWSWRRCSRGKGWLSVRVLS